MNMYIWTVGPLNQLFLRDSNTESRELVPKISSFWKVNFVLSVLFILTFAFEKVVLCGYFLVKKYSRFLKNSFSFSENLFQS